MDIKKFTKNDILYIKAKIKASKLEYKFSLYTFILIQCELYVSGSIYSESVSNEFKNVF